MNLKPRFSDLLETEQLLVICGCSLDVLHVLGDTTLLCNAEGTVVSIVKCPHLGVQLILTCDNVFSEHGMLHILDLVFHLVPVRVLVWDFDLALLWWLTFYKSVSRKADTSFGEISSEDHKFDGIVYRLG
ncbi:hypothetical protein Dimus_028224 [Dionaea muscipula]